MLLWTLTHHKWDVTICPASHLFSNASWGAFLPHIYCSRGVSTSRLFNTITSLFYGVYASSHGLGVCYLLMWQNRIYRQLFLNDNGLINHLSYFNRAFAHIFYKTRFCLNKCKILTDRYSPWSATDNSWVISGKLI